jgi:carbon monoxide dehydrogenase subunit G
MEHESFVAMPPSRLLQALRTPGVVAASLPGWQPDEEGTRPATGRLRLRIGGSTITYRGTVGVMGDGPVFTVVAEGTEVRGSGTVKATADVTVEATDLPEPGTLLTWQGSAQADGRLSGYEEAVVESAVRRLLDRFAAELAAHAPGADTKADTRPDADADLGVDADAEPDAEEEPDVVDHLGEPLASSELEDFELVEVEVEVPESAAALDDLVPPAEAAHARRTMIGRSAEEVDHAPPRGRYAPVPGPEAGTATAALRWAAPAAAALIASAVVVGRALRRRR